MKSPVPVAALLFASGAAQAQVWIEVPDAPAAPASQVTIGVGPLTEITGNADFFSDTVDAYCIYITDPAAFSATTVGGALFDTQLFLFNALGIGITHNDDSGIGVQSTITGMFVPSPGFYILAISRYDTDPLGPTGAQIWADTPFGLEHAPDGPDAPGPVTGWTAGPDLGPYSIFLTGATFCEVPAPGAVALMGLTALVACRRRRA